MNTYELHSECTKLIKREDVQQNIKQVQLKLDKVIRRKPNQQNHEETKVEHKHTNCEEQPMWIRCLLLFCLLQPARTYSS